MTTLYWSQRDGVYYALREPAESGPLHEIGRFHDLATFWRSDSAVVALRASSQQAQSTANGSQIVAQVVGHPCCRWPVAFVGRGPAVLGDVNDLVTRSRFSGLVQMTGLRTDAAGF